MKPRKPEWHIKHLKNPEQFAEGSSVSFAFGYFLGHQLYC